MKDKIIGPDDLVLVTGAAGFIGTHVVKSLLAHGCRHLRCLVRPSGNTAALEEIIRNAAQDVKIELMRGNLLSVADCNTMVKDVAVIYHLAAGTGEKSYPDAFMNSVVTTRNLLEAIIKHRHAKRIVSISSFAVYSNRNKPSGKVLDELAPVEPKPAVRGEAYCYAKVKQDEILQEYGKAHGIPYVILRPGVVYGPEKEGLSGRVGWGGLGVYLHCGGSNQIPLTYVENCADAIVLAGLVKGVDGEVFNIVDDDLPTSRYLLRHYKKTHGRFLSIYLPKRSEERRVG